MLTPTQQKWVDHLSDVDLIKVFPFDPTSEDKFQKLKARIVSVIGSDYEILHRGASALKISGQKEIDVYIPVSVEEMVSLAPKMEAVFGKPKSVYPERIKFWIDIEGTKAETMLYDKNHPTWSVQEKFFKYLKENPDMLEKYKKLKEEGGGVSVREYYRRKIEFINKIGEQIERPLPKP